MSKYVNLSLLVIGFVVFLFFSNTPLNAQTSDCNVTTGKPEGCYCGTHQQCASFSCIGANIDPVTGYGTAGTCGAVPTPTSSSTAGTGGSTYSCFSSTNRPNNCLCSNDAQCASNSCKSALFGLIKICMASTITPTPTVTPLPTPIPTSSPTPTKIPTPTATGTTITPSPTLVSGVTPTLTVFPSLTLVPTITIPALTCDPVPDGVIDQLDFQRWKDEFTQELPTTTAACLSPNNVVDQLGFQAWKEIAILKTKQPF